MLAANNVCIFPTQEAVLGAGPSPLPLHLGLKPTMPPRPSALPPRHFPAAGGPPQPLTQCRRRCCLSRRRAPRGAGPRHPPRPGQRRRTRPAAPPAGPGILPRRRRRRSTGARCAPRKLPAQAERPFRRAGACCRHLTGTWPAQYSAGLLGNPTRFDAPLRINSVDQGRPNSCCTFCRWQCFQLQQIETPRRLLMF